MNNYFKILRSGTHSSFQDYGFKYVQHLGITTSGVVDKELYELANNIIGNDLNTPVLEFAYQGPILKLCNGKCRFIITGNVAFNIKRQKEIDVFWKKYENDPYCWSFSMFVRLICTCV